MAQLQEQPKKRRGGGRGSRTRGQARARQIEREAVKPHLEREHRLLAARDLDALQREQWRREGRTADALRELTTAFTGRRQLNVVRVGVDGQPEVIAAPMEPEGPAYLWRRSGSTRGLGPPEALYRLSWALATGPEPEEPPPEEWRDIGRNAPLIAKAQHRLAEAKRRATWSADGEDINATTSCLVLVGRPTDVCLDQRLEADICQRCRQPTDRRFEPCPPCRKAAEMFTAWVLEERERRGARVRAARQAAARLAASEEAARLRHRADLLEKQMQINPQHQH